ncbi:MAG: DUF2341 domain-containing protein [Kiritimatiellae bacterium]|nr:DUF2341 domain-containing protein [Kiritimatiellia bacterium]
MKVSSIVLATLAGFSGAAFGDDVATIEAGLKSDIMGLVNQVNPIDSATGERKYISFALISDIHKCKRVAGDDAASNPVTTYWYGSASCLTEAEQSIRLLGSVASDAGLDAVINGGDMSTAPIYNGGAQNMGLTEVEYTNEIWNVKAMFDQYIPAGVPRFTVDGNHERNYSLNGANMHMSDDAWAYVLTNFNTSATAAHSQGVDITYHRDLPNAKLNNGTGHFTGNSYHLDFRRLLASGGPNVRIACVSLYDTANGGKSEYRAYDAAQFYDVSGNLIDPALTPENTVMGMVAHGAEEKVSGYSGRAAAADLQCGYINGYTNPSSHNEPWNLGTHKGKGFFGLVAAHFHFTNEKEIASKADQDANPGNTIWPSAISVASAYAVNCPSKPKNHELGTEAAYHFSIFVVDTDSKKLREIRLGGWSGTYPNPHENPVVQLHDTNIRMSSSGSQPVQTAPVIGTVTVAPAVSNATISGSISSLGSDATACDVYLALGTSANALGASTKIATAATSSFSYSIPGLAPSTTYYYSISVTNNAATAKGAAKSGSFTTNAEQGGPGPQPPDPPVPGDMIVPCGDDNAPTIQAAIDAAAATHGTVVLSNGVFDVKSQLMVTGGVTVVGQGWTNTVIRFTGSKGGNARVADISGGSTLSHVTLTGGKVNSNYGSGGGASITDGTISWCRIVDNYAERYFGGGVFVGGSGNVKIDHSIISENSAGTAFLDGAGGGIGIRGDAGLRVEIDSCLISGNVSGASGRTSPGGGIAIIGKGGADRVTAVVRNTTIVNNQSLGSGLGGGLYSDQNNTTLVNCIISGNAADTGDANAAFAVAGQTSNCIIGGSPAFVNAEGGDFHLAEGSAAIGAGASYEGIGSDLDGVAFASTPSIGCFEYAGEVTPGPGPGPGPEPQPEQEGEWARYKWAVIGDSLSDPVHPTANDAVVKYYHYLSLSTGVQVVYTNAVGGTGYKSGCANGKAFCQRIEANPIPSDVNVVTIFGSVNDGSQAASDEAAGSPTDSLPTTNTLAAYINRAIDLVQTQAPNAKLILVGGLYYCNAHPQNHVRANETLRAVAAARGVEFHDWLTENPDDPFDFHQIEVNTLTEGSFARQYTIDWNKYPDSSFGHPNDTYNEICLAPRFGELLSAAIMPTLADVAVTPVETTASISGAIATVGTGATACDVYLAVGTSANALGVSVKIASSLGLADTFSYAIQNLEEGTTYCYELSVSNNASFAVGTSLAGSFKTKSSASQVSGLGDFAKKVTFTVAYDGASALSGIPVLVKLSADSPVGFIYSDCEADGSDIRFADSEGNAIPFEIDTWNTSGESLIWVKAPALAQGTAFTMYYSGTPAAANAPASVWSDYSGVWHLNGLGADATPNSQGLYPNSTAATGIDGHLSAMSIPNEAGRFGKSFRVNDSTGWNVGNFNEGGVWVNDAGTDSPLDGNGVFTISGWFKHNSWQYNYDKLLFKRPDESNNAGTDGSFVSLISSNANDTKIAVRGASTARLRLENADERKADMLGNWVYLTLVFNGATCSIYENGEFCKSGTIAAATDNDHPLVFGNNANIISGTSGTQAWNGWIDEVRLLRSAKSSDWIAAEYAAMASGSFVSAGEVEDVGGSVTPIDPVDPIGPVLPTNDFAKCIAFTTSGYHGSAPLANFPVLVRLSTAIDGFSYEDFGASTNLVFKDADGNAIPYEIESWNTSGTSLVWVKVPSVSSATTFTMHYCGSSAAANDSAATWTGASYVGVWHMDEANGVVADATGHGLSATPTGAANVDVVSVLYAGNDAPIGGARATGSSSVKGYLSIPSYDSFNVGDTFTVSGWVRLTENVANNPRLFSRKDSYSSNNGWEVEMATASPAGFNVRGAARDKDQCKGQFSPNLQNRWTHVAFVYDGTTCSVYSNGCLLVSGSVTAATDNGLPLAIGCDSDGSEANIRGAFDECRLLDAVASADWVLAEFEQAGTSFLTNGGVQVADAPTRSETSTTPVAVPYAWLVGNGLATASTTEADYESAALGTAANGLSVWECYEASLDPNDPDAKLRLNIVMGENGPVVSWEPNDPERVYTVEGKSELPDAEWGPTNTASRFFRVKVSVK